MTESIYDIVLAAVQMEAYKYGYAARNIIQRTLFIHNQHRAERYPNGMEERLMTPITKEQLDRVRELKSVTVQLLSFDDKADRKTIRAQYERKKVQNTKDQSRFVKFRHIGAISIPA